MSTTAITTVGNATHCVAKKVPTLRRGDDAKFAAELEQYIQEAESGLRSILKAGFFLECIAGELPKGQLGPWVEAHCRGRTWRTVQRWKEIAGKLGDAVGISLKKRLALRCDEILSLPLGKLTPEQKPIREKLDAEIAGKSYRQLFMDFKQAEEDEDGNLKKKRGRLKGQGGASKDQRLTAAEVKEKARVLNMQLEAKEFAGWILKHCGPEGVAKIEPEAFAEFFEAYETGWDFLSKYHAAQKKGAK